MVHIVLKIPFIFTFLRVVMKYRYTEDKLRKYINTTISSLITYNSENFFIRSNVFSLSRRILCMEFVVRVVQPQTEPRITES